MKNTHLLLLRGSGKSFWKKDKDKDKQGRSGTERFEYTFVTDKGRANLSAEDTVSVFSALS